MEELKGYVEKIIYTNEENGHTILEVELSNDEVKRLKDNCEEYADEIYNSMVCVGILNLVHTGSYVVFKGDFLFIQVTESSLRRSHLKKRKQKMRCL